MRLVYLSKFKTVKKNFMKLNRSMFISEQEGNGYPGFIW